MKNKTEAINDLFNGIAVRVDDFEHTRELLLAANELYEIFTQKNLFTENELNEKLAELQNSSTNPQMRHLAITASPWGKLITFTIVTDEDYNNQTGEYKYDIHNENGVYGYVWNVDDDLFSEYGYSFFKNYKRVG